MSLSSIRSMSRFESPLSFTCRAGIVRTRLPCLALLSTTHRLRHKRAALRGSTGFIFFCHFSDDHSHAVSHILAVGLCKCAVRQAGAYADGSDKVALLDPDSPMR